MLIKETICLEAILENSESEKLVHTFQESIKLADEKIKNANKITYVKELMEVRSE